MAPCVARGRPPARTDGRSHRTSRAQSTRQACAALRRQPTRRAPYDRRSPLHRRALVRGDRRRTQLPRWDHRFSPQPRSSRTGLAPRASQKRSLTTMPPKIQINLASALAPVKAPDELWARVDAALPHSRTSSWRGFAMAAALAALMSGGVLYLRAQSYSSSFAATAANLHQHREGNSGFYAVQRHTVDGQPVTIVSVADDT